MFWFLIDAKHVDSETACNNCVNGIIMLEQAKLERPYL